MNRYWKLVAGGGLGVAVVLATSGGAAAAPIVNSWSYTLNNAFFDFQPGSVIGSGANPEVGGSTRIEWPAAFDGATSALEVEHDAMGVVGGTVTTNGGLAAGPDLLHINNPVPSSMEQDFLVSGRLSVQATLTPLDPAAEGSAGPFETFFDFTFKETENEGPCGFASETTCDDIFLLVGTGESTQTFDFLGETYTLTFGSERLATLSDEQCAEVGQAPGCIGFLTQENGTTVFDTFISVTGPEAPVAVSEPGTVALLGAGLVALGFVGRRRNPRANL
jgi:hypothetical protein